MPVSHQLSCITALVLLIRFPPTPTSQLPPQQIYPSSALNPQMAPISLGDEVKVFSVSYKTYVT